jgi:signal transduction histidine kinase
MRIISILSHATPWEGKGARVCKLWLLCGLKNAAFDFELEEANMSALPPAQRFQGEKLEQETADETRENGESLHSSPSDANGYLTEFLATLAHELRHPLAPIKTGLDILRLRHTDPLTLTKTLDMMERQVRQMSDLIDDLFDMARISSGKLTLRQERVALADIVSDALETSQPLIEAGHHQLRVDIPDKSLALYADPRRVNQMLVNLLNNAAKYTPAGGRIELSAHQEGDEVLISVSDNGVGISPESLAVIFDMFTQIDDNACRAQGGLGIGLPLVRQLVELHGGTVTGASAGAGQGSVFTIRLPLASAGPKASSAIEG